MCFLTYIRLFCVSFFLSFLCDFFFANLPPFIKHLMYKFPEALIIAGCFIKVKRVLYNTCQCIIRTHRKIVKQACEVELIGEAY